MNDSSKRRSLVVLVSLSLLLLLLFWLSLSIGASQISLTSLWQGEDSMAYRIVRHVRLPRSLAAMLAGLALGVCGVILQVVLNNPLAGPSIIGVNAGAGLASILVLALLPVSYQVLPVAGFLGALVAVLLVYLIAQKTGASRMTIVLAGIAVSSLLSACTDTIITLFPQTQFGRMDFLIGSFSSVTMDQVRFSMWYIIIAVVVVCFLAHDMNILALGDETAQSLGLRVKGLRLVLLVLAALLSGSAISLCGLIGFVGLVVPHIARMLVGTDNRMLLPVSGLIGAVATLGCDMLARTVFAPYELPVGIVLSVLGSPFFLYLLLSRKRRSVVV